jgi:hypothetical protein
MARRDWKETRATNGQRLLAILRGCAIKSRPCPDVGVIAKDMKVTHFMVTTLFDDLRASGDIDWQVVFCGQAAGKRRWVRLLKDCMTTARPVNKHRAYVKAPTDPTLLDRARVTLQRRGHYVWDARISGGPKGMVKVDRKLLAPADVIAMAGLSIEQRV